MLTYSSYFFICYLVSKRPTLCHWQNDILIHSMLITAFLSFVFTHEFLKAKDGLQTDPQSRRLTDTYANWWTRKSKNLKKQTVFCQCWSPRYRVSVLSIRCGECHPKGLIVASSYEIKETKIIIIITRISTNITFIWQFQFLF